MKRWYLALIVLYTHICKDLLNNGSDHGAFELPHIKKKNKQKTVICHKRLLNKRHYELTLGQS